MRDEFQYIFPIKRLDSPIFNTTYNFAHWKPDRHDIFTSTLTLI